MKTAIVTLESISWYQQGKFYEVPKLESDKVVESWTSLECPRLLISMAGEKKIRIRVRGNYWKGADKVPYNPEPIAVIWETEFDVPEKVINMSVEIERIFDKLPTKFKCQCCGNTVG